MVGGWVMLMFKESWHDPLRTGMMRDVFNAACLEFSIPGGCRNGVNSKQIDGFLDIKGIKEYRKMEENCVKFKKSAVILLNGGGYMVIWL